MVYQVFDFTSDNSSLMSIVNKVNSFTDVGEGGIFGIFILLVTFVPLFLMMRSYGNERAFAVAGLISGVIAIFLRILLLINDATLTVMIIISAGAIILLLKDAGQYE